MFKGEKMGYGETTESSPDFSILQKLYKSKFLRYLIIAGTLSFSNQFSCMEKGHKEEVSSAQVELAQKVLDLGEQSEKFTEYVAQEGNPYLLSIGQIHSSFFLSGTEKSFEDNENGIKDLIENQKDIESLVLGLVSKYGIKKVYLESTPSSWGLEGLRSFKQEMSSLEGNSRLERIGKAYEESQSAFDCQRGPLLYLLKLELEKTDVAGLDPDQKNIFDTLQSKVVNDSLISGDNLYVWGGVVKLFIEGKVDVAIADDPNSEEEAVKTLEHGDVDTEEIEDLNARLESSRLKASALQKEKDFIKNSAVANDIRENAAVSGIIQDAGRNPQSFYPIVYGIAHDFTNNVCHYNSEHGSELGLINIYQKPSKTGDK